MKRHETDALSLIFGLLFLAGAAWWGIYEIFQASEVPVTLAVAITLVVIGAVGLMTAVPRRRTAIQPAVIQPAVIPAEPVVPTEPAAVDFIKKEDDTVIGD
ncbi:hypothetical protein [Fodinicola feengrottensis]|uniref:Uncharacterized protein n=1 Tax=Fodinicola feengrottensis TaxID=435914 RepID=A0ABP4S8M2_9ACTN|nr:hypothetical protein [Fodinicola feengrottensis]